MPFVRIHVDVQEQDIELGCRGKSIGCMVQRAIMRACPGLFGPSQVEVEGWQGLDWFISIHPYSSMLFNKKAINHPNLINPEEQWSKARASLEEAPMWNRQVNPRGVLIRFGNLRGKAKGLEREDINLAISAWDYGYTVQPFSFEFEVELRPEWDFHQMDLFPWYEYTGVHTGQILHDQIVDALLADKWGEEVLPELELVVV